MANPGGIFIDPKLTQQDQLVLINLVDDMTAPSGNNGWILRKLRCLNDPKHTKFDPTVFVSYDFHDFAIDSIFSRFLLQPYVKWAQKVVRVETDVVFLTHLILYFFTLVPSAILLFYSFSWGKVALHWFLVLRSVSYTLLMHQHIHGGGVLAKRYAWFDRVFPYILDPIMGHTWNTYYYHHVKHHHVEGNGPADLSSTLRYQRDDTLDFIRYLVRFLLLVDLELPYYFVRKGQAMNAFKLLVSEASNFMVIYFLATRVHFKATFSTLLVPLLVMRVGLMVGNWGQHAFVDEDNPDSDFRSSITLIDVASNRECFNDGYHTSHHLNPRRHWRDHPIAFMKQKHDYAGERALVFHNIDFIMITIRLLRKDYAHLAKCLVPIGDQIRMSLKERAEMLERKTRKFTEDEIARKFRKRSWVLGVRGVSNNEKRCVPSSLSSV